MLSRQNTPIVTTEGVLVSRLFPTDMTKRKTLCVGGVLACQTNADQGIWSLVYERGDHFLKVWTKSNNLLTYSLGKKIVRIFQLY